MSLLIAAAAAGAGNAVPLAAAASKPFVLLDHLPVLQVVIPLLAATLCALLPRGIYAWAFTLIVSWTLPITAAALLWRVLSEGTISYPLGGWLPPIGIEYRIDALNAFVMLLVSGIGAVALPYARVSVDHEIEQRQQPWFYASYLLCIGGLLGIAATGDAFNIFVFLEISSLATYVMIAMGNDRRALLAAYQYLILGTVGATLYVIGVGLLYNVTGTLNLADMAQRLGPAFDESNRPILAGIAFIFVGVALKLALFPMHVWLPNAYAFAPSFATVFLSATATKVAVYLLLRMMFTVFGAAIALDSLPLAQVLLILSLIAMFVCSFLAVFEDSIERMLAYSSLAQIGYMTLGVSLANEPGLTGGIVHLFNHALIKAALFMAAGIIFFRLGTSRLSQLAGIGQRMPLTMAAFVVAGLGIIGVPGTAGFISKWYLAIGAVEGGQWPVVFLIMASSLIALIYIGKVVEVAYFRDLDPRCDKASDPPASMMVPLLVLTAMIVFFGLDTTWSADIAERAARGLLTGLK